MGSSGANESSSFAGTRTLVGGGNIKKSILKGNTRSESEKLVAAVKSLSSSITTHQLFWDVT
jgi:hypothetical protein